MRKIKDELRAEYKKKRKNMSDKFLSDREIQKTFLESDIYNNAQSILCYCALKDEISTDQIIKKAFEDKKTVAVPRCLDADGNMEFFVIHSLSDLSQGAYNIREPKDTCAVFNNFENSVILVPALCFDKNGFRLGYGKGYYDRYLQKHAFICVGLCYNSNIVNQLPVDCYDRAVDCIVTQNKIFDCKNGGKNG